MLTSSMYSLLAAREAFRRGSRGIILVLVSAYLTQMPPARILFAAERQRWELLLGCLASTSSRYAPLSSLFSTSGFFYYYSYYYYPYILFYFRIQERERERKAKIVPQIFLYSAIFAPPRDVATPFSKSCVIGSCARSSSTILAASCPFYFTRARYSCRTSNESNEGAPIIYCL